MQFQTGDLILYHTQKWYSWIIQFLTKSRYSHISIILKQPTWLDETLIEEYYVLESVLSTENKIGVRITPFKSVYEDYKNGMGRLYVRKLSTSIPQQELQEKIKKWYHTILSAPYDTDLMDWLKAYQEEATVIEDADKLKGYQRTDKFWCSALVSYIYVKCGLLNDKVPWTLITPNDYSVECSILPFTNCKLEPETELS